MSALGHQFYNRNSNRAYPLDDSATGRDDAGLALPHGLLADCALRFPASLGSYAFVGGVTVSSRLITMTLQASSLSATQVGTPVVQPLGAVTILRDDFVRHRHYDISGQVAGVGGWLVFGDGIEELYNGRFSSVRQSMLLPRCARPYAPLPITSLGKQHVAPPLTGVVQLRGGQDIEVLGADLEIDGEMRRAIMVRLKNRLDRNVFTLYKGPCGGRPESDTCLRPNIQQLGPAIPDCNGNIQITFNNLTTYEPQAGEGGVGLDFPIGLAAVCVNRDRLPDAEGNLPGLYDDLCASESSISVPGDSSESSSNPSEDSVDSSSVVCNDLPFMDIFDDGLHSSWVVRFGSYELVPDACVEGESIVSLSSGLSEDNGLALAATHLGRRNVIVWEDCGYTSSLGLSCETVVQLVSGVERNGGIVVNWHRVGPTSQEQYYLVAINKNTDAFEIRFYNGTTLSAPLISVSPIGIVVGDCYKIIVTTEQISPSQVRIDATLQGVTDTGFDEVTVQLTTNTYLPDDGRFGVGSNRAEARFSYFILEPV